VRYVVSLDSRSTNAEFHGTRNRGIDLKGAAAYTLIFQGFTNKEVATDLNLAEQTVRDHIHKILRKTGVSHRPEAVDVCRGSGAFA